MLEKHHLLKGGGEDHLWILGEAGGFSKCFSLHWERGFLEGMRDGRGFSALGLELRLKRARREVGRARRVSDGRSRLPGKRKNHIRDQGPGMRGR